MFTFLKCFTSLLFSQVLLPTAIAVILHNVQLAKAQPAQHFPVSHSDTHENIATIYQRAFLKTSNQTSLLFLRVLIRYTIVTLTAIKADT